MQEKPCNLALRAMLAWVAFASRTSESAKREKGRESRRSRRLARVETFNANTLTLSSATLCRGSAASQEARKGCRALLECSDLVRSMSSTLGTLGSSCALN